MRESTDFSNAVGDNEDHITDSVSTIIELRLHFVLSHSLRKRRIQEIDLLLLSNAKVPPWRVLRT